MKYYKESDIRGARFKTISNPYSQGWNHGIDSILENATPIEIPTWIPIERRPLSDDEWENVPEEAKNILYRQDCWVFKNQMPERGQEILICTEEGSIEIACITKKNDPRDWEGITAWMPLPKPYQKEETEA